MTTLLVTGFGPFPGWERNPTPAMVKAVTALRLPGVRIVGHVFNTVYAEVERDLPALIARHRPDAVLLFGLAGRTGHVRIEKHAHNVTTRRVPDASGAFHASADIRADAAWRVPTGFACGPLVARLRRAGLNARPSPSAGDYLCNFSYWLALEAVARHEVKRALFVHVPLPLPMGRSARGAFTRRMTTADLAAVAREAAAAITGRSAYFTKPLRRPLAHSARP
ncbi:pyroglutamyl-peptidase I [Phreatobacter oligotrophus]|jgi:pyroglutamyl-peptidase|uniref:Pyrrolidone-carboxylate peptidase n=1 Tax=Phreatobacter oligotrophus TaxID=1122261 RepID=A0A2T4ZFP2_9HYPH|nr:pyroglutamyl-peptidase I [Phreatobacter oligotrophus]PTM60729.1 pyroglutamyl-peptidase [Phreatobacter oligotrophus]